MIQQNKLLIILVIVGLFASMNAQQVVEYGCSKNACWKDCGTGNLACYTRAPNWPDHGRNSNIASCSSDADCNAEWNCATTCAKMAV
jgi:hypothetical protein